MTNTEIKALLSTYNPDHYPSILVTKGTNKHVWGIQILINNDISIIKFTPEHYNGNWECFGPGIFDDTYRSPSLKDLIDYILSVYPKLLYSPTLSPERFL